MKYLFGDSGPFPHPFDFLRTLEAFMTAATRVVMLEVEGQKLSRDIQTAGKARAVGIEAVQAIHDRMMRALNEAAGPHGPSGTMITSDLNPSATAYAHKLKELSERLVETEKQNHKQKSEGESAHINAETERRAVESQAELEQFFKIGDLPVLGSRFGMRLSGGRHELVVVYRNPNGITTGFNLSADRTPAWQAPRKVSDFSPNLNLGIGVKKSLFKSSVAPESVHLDDYIVSRFDLTADAAEIALRKKLELKDTYAFHLKRQGDVTLGEVDRLEDPAARTLGNALDLQDAARLDQLWLALDKSFRELLPNRERTTVLELDSKDVGKSRLAMQLVLRLIAMFAPLVTEVAERSPNAHELSLKIEHESGRREEIYLKRDELLKKLQPLPAAGREIFAPLGLDSWVPSLSMRPPDVV